MGPKDLAAIARVCQKHGIIKLKMQDVELEFDPTSIPPSKARPISQGAGVKPGAPADLPADLSEEDVLFWSSNETA